MALQGKVVLVTGANGFLGSRVVERLAREGLKVRALIRRPESQAELTRLGAEPLIGEVTDAATQRAAVRGAHFVVHSVATASQDLAEARRINAESAAGLAAASLAEGCERFVHISTLAVYDMRGRDTVDEATPLVTQGDAYSVTKAEADRAVLAAIEKGLKGVILRPPLILGVHPTSTWGTLIPRALAAGQFALVDGGRTRIGYVHVDRLVEVIFRALQIDGAVGQVFNVVDGNIAWRQYTDYFTKAPLPEASPDQVPSFLSFRGTLLGEKTQRILGLAPKDTFEAAMAEILASARQA
ncbi:MAG TPA: NAD-dependent epimerase/dehydratase family protein [Myxococcaceae bacterium]|jgi:nucleoside-diphosphate-sugar epimerase